MHVEVCSRRRYITLEFGITHYKLVEPQEADVFVGENSDCFADFIFRCVGLARYVAGLNYPDVELKQVALCPGADGEYLRSDEAVVIDDESRPRRTRRHRCRRRTH